MADEWLDLSKVVHALRRELTAAAAAGKDEKGVHFEVGPIETEFLVEVRAEGGGEAGIRFGVITIAGKGTVASGSTHRVKLVLTPKDDSGRPLTVSSRDAYIPDR